MPAISINGAKVLFVHIPKTGGYTIDVFMKNLSQEFGDGKLDLFSTQRAVCAKCTPQHYTREIIELLLDVDSFDAIFSVTRNPLQKLVSEFKWRVHLGDQSTEPGFSEWYAKWRMQYKVDKYIKDNHFRHQTHFLMDQSKIFKFEDGLDCVFKYLFDVCKITAAQRSAFAFESLNIFGWNEILSGQGGWRRNAYEKRSPSKEDITLIKSDYSIDYELLGYSLDD